jgi:hypothetical protein
MVLVGSSKSGVCMIQGRGKVNGVTGFRRVPSCPSGAYIYDV